MSVAAQTFPASMLAARRRAAGLPCLALALALLAGAATAQEIAAPQAAEAQAVEAQAQPAQLPELARGKASWYGPRFHGRRTSSGERFDMNALTAAHPDLPFGTRVRVRNEANGREVVVRINDRGSMRGRIIDLSKAAAASLGFLRAGEARVVLIKH